MAHFLFITYVRLLQKFEILAGKLIMRLHPRWFRLNQRTQNKAEAEGPVQSADIEKENHSVLGKRMSALVLHPSLLAQQLVKDGGRGWPPFVLRLHTSSRSFLFPPQTRRRVVFSGHFDQRGVRNHSR